MKFSKEKIAAAITNHKYSLGAAASACTAVALSSPAFASDITTTTEVSGLGAKMAEILKSSLETMIVDFMAYVTVVLPIAMTVFGTMWGTKLVMRYFRSTAKA